MSINPQGNSIDKLFSSNVHYRVPRYQRRYVWDETNWDTLWKDILFQLEDGDRPTHFTGPIVTRSIDTMAYEVIDGQQRLATFQIILCVIRDLCKTQNNPQIRKLADSTAKYIVNDEDVSIDNTDYEFTFNPTEHDQIAFSRVISGEYAINREESDKHSILKAYNHFSDIIQKHMKENFDFEKMRRLLRSITDNFMLVNLELGGEDERPEKVFASINATGRKLSEFDYLRNDLFLRAADRAEEFYENHWIFEKKPEYWKEHRLDSFFRAFLVAKQGPDCFEKNAKPIEVYQQYREGLTTEQEIEYEFEQLKDYAETYNGIDTSRPTDIRMRFYQVLDFMFEDLNTTAFVVPIVLFLTHDVEISDEELTQVFDILESYIIRGLLHHGVNDDKQLKKLLEKIKNAFIDGHSDFSVENFAKFLSDKYKGRIWLDNEQFVNGLRQTAHQMSYSGRSRRRFVMNMLSYILYRIELWKIECWNQENPTKERKAVTFNPEDFLRPTEDDGPQGDIQTNLSFFLQMLMSPSKRHKPIDSYSIGNLVFCTEHLPNDLLFDNIKSALSQNANASIMLNRELCKKYKSNDTWGIPQIRDQEKMLLDCFHKIWHPPEYFTGEIPKPKVECRTDSSGQISKSESKSNVEPRWISMVKSDNSELVTFFTYSQAKDLSGIKIHSDKITGINRDRDEQTLEKSNILFVCSKKIWPEIDPYIAILSYVRSELLQAPQNQSERLKVEDKILTLAQQRQTMVSLVTRCGHLLNGTIENFDKDVICMQIMEHPVIVYRHSIYELATGEWSQGKVTEFDEAQGLGYIKSSKHSRIFVHGNEIRDKNLSVLQPGQNVEFEVNLTTKGLSAIDVVLAHVKNEGK